MPKTGPVNRPNNMNAQKTRMIVESVRVKSENQTFLFILRNIRLSYKTGGLQSLKYGAWASCPHLGLRTSRSLIFTILPQKQKFLLISHFLRAGRPRSIILNFFPEKNQKRLFFPRFPATIAKSWIIVPCFFHFSLKKGEFSCLALSRLFCPFCPPPL